MKIVIEDIIKTDGFFDQVKGIEDLSDHSIPVGSHDVEHIDDWLERADEVLGVLQITMRETDWAISIYGDYAIGLECEAFDHVAEKVLSNDSQCLAVHDVRMIMPLYFHSGVTSLEDMKKGFSLHLLTKEDGQLVATVDAHIE